MIRGLTVLDTRAGWDEKCSRRETVGQKQMRPWTRPELQPADEGENKEEHGWCRKRNNNKTTLKKKKSNRKEKVSSMEEVRQERKVGGQRPATSAFFLAIFGHHRPHPGSREKAN